MIKVFITIEDLNKMGANPSYTPDSIWLERKLSPVSDLVEITIPLEKWESWKHLVKKRMLWD